MSSFALNFPVVGYGLFHYTLSRRQGNTLDTLPIYQRAIHKDSSTHSNVGGLTHLVSWLIQHFGPDRGHQPATLLHIACGSFAFHCWL